MGQAAKLALEDYVTELNENGGLLGKQVKLITYDYSKDPATEAVNATNKLIQQDGVIAILGPSGSQSAIMTFCTSISLIISFSIFCL